MGVAADDGAAVSLDGELVLIEVGDAGMVAEFGNRE
jgi:hypothetical protein